MHIVVSGTSQRQEYTVYRDTLNASTKRQQPAQLKANSGRQRRGKYTQFYILDSLLCINRNIKGLFLEMYDYTEGENILETLNLWKVIMYKYKYKR